MRGYWNDPERTAEVMSDDGWILTGDLGRFRDDGNLVLCGRVTEMYIRGGYNVYPSEVEDRLGQHPKVARAALLGVSDPVFGGLAVSLIFGTFASTVLTLFVIPLVYYLYEQHQHTKE